MIATVLIAATTHPFQIILAGIALGGEILVSELLCQLTESSREFVFGQIREVELKGLAGVQRLCAVGWDGGEPEEAEPTPAVPTPSAGNGNVFRRAGDFWSIAYDGQKFSLRDTKGLNFIARLLSEPGREIHALDIIGADRGAGAADAGGQIIANLGSAGDVLDDQARAEYKERLEDLRSEIEEARAANDIGRTERLQEEIDLLTRELSAAFGLGGRARKSGDAAERARKSVQGRISESLTRIRKEHASLALHLTNAIRLGTFCCYQPEKPTSWEL